MPDPLVVYTFFQSAKHTQGEPRLKSLRDFAADAAISYKFKADQPLIVPDQLPDHSRASGVAPIAATSLFLDFDKPGLVPDAAVKVLNKLRAAYVLYCTYSWSKDKPKYRVVLPLGKPIPVQDRRHILARLATLLPGIAPETGDSKRGFYVGMNGTNAPRPVWKTGLTADLLELPEAPLPAKEPLPSGISTKDNPYAKAQELKLQLGRKLKDGDGRWAAVEFLATRMSARMYDEDKCYSWLGEMIATYFDAAEVTAEDRKKWELRVAYWLNRDAPKRRESLTQHQPRVTGSLVKGLPSSFTADELLDMQLPETKWILEGLLPPGLALIAGPPKVGKSQLVLDLALAVAAGKPFLGKYIARKCKVVYFDLESGHHLLKERLLPTMSARNILAKDLRGYMSFSLVMDTGANAIKQLRSELEDHKDIGLVIVDLFARIRDAENPQRKSVYQLDYDVMSQFQDICAEHPDLCILLVHHSNKRSISQADHWQDTISGSHGLAGATHTNLAMQRISKQGVADEAELKLMKTFCLLQVAGKRVKDTELVLKQAGDGVSWGISDKTMMEVKQTTLQQEIIAVLKSDLDRLWSSTEVATSLGRSLATIKMVMHRMTKRGELKSPTGKGFTTAERAAGAKPYRQHPAVGRKKGAPPEGDAP